MNWTARASTTFSHVAPRLCHRRGGMRVSYWNHALRDDRAGVEIIGDDMRRRADDLYSALVRLMIGFCADKSRQKRVVNVDHPIGIARHELRRENTHVFGEHDVFRRIILNHFGNPVFMSGALEFSWLTQ